MPRSYEQILDEVRTKCGRNNTAAQVGSLATQLELAERQIERLALTMRERQQCTEERVSLWRDALKTL